MLKKGDLVKFNKDGIDFYSVILENDVHKTYVVHKTANHNYLVLIIPYEFKQPQIANTLAIKTSHLKNVTRLKKIESLLNKKED